MLLMRHSAGEALHSFRVGSLSIIGSAPASGLGIMALPSLLAIRCRTVQ